MKIKKPSGKSLGSSVAQAGGVVTGMVLSNGVAGAIPLENKTLAKAIVLGVGVALAASTSGTGGTANFAKAAGIGMAAQQGKELVNEYVGPIVPANKFLDDSFEKGTVVPSTVALNARRKRRRSLGSPEVNNFRLGSSQPEMGAAQGGQFKVIA